MKVSKTSFLIIPIDALKDVTKMVQTFGCSMEKAALEFKRFGVAAKKLEEESENEVKYNCIRR